MKTIQSLRSLSDKELTQLLLEHVAHYQIIEGVTLVDGYAVLPEKPSKWPITFWNDEAQHWFVIDSDEDLHRYYSIHPLYSTSQAYQMLYEAFDDPMCDIPRDKILCLAALKVALSEERS